MKNLPKTIYLNIDEEEYEELEDFNSIKDNEAITWSTRDMNEQRLRYVLAKSYLGSEELIKAMQKHKKNIGKEKCTYSEGTLLGYMLGIGTELPSCGKCKYFEVSNVDPNRHFGYCNMHSQNDDNDLQIVCEDVTLTISDFCSRFKSK